MMVFRLPHKLHVLRCASLGALCCALIVFGEAQTSNADDHSSSSPTTSESSVPTFSAHVKVVNLLAAVRDKHGQIINNLDKNDFTLEEDGRPQTIKYFTRDTDLPLKIGLLVDTSGSVLQVLPDERSASDAFLDEMLRPVKDSAFVIHFDRQVELLQDFTSSREKLQSAVQQLEPSPRDESSGSGGGSSGSGPPYGRPGGHRHAGGGTLLYDAVDLASDELMQKQQGRKALIILTDGEDRGSKTSLASAIEAAQRSDTLVYCIYFKGQESGNFGGFQRGGGGGPWGRGGMGRGGPGRVPQESHEDGKKVLGRIAKETGARVFEVSKKQPISQIYTEIQEELRNQYNIGYTPDRAPSASAYHKIHLTANVKDRIVQTRDGYYD
jgi:VWFA-related protein